MDASGSCAGRRSSDASVSSSVTDRQESHVERLERLEQERIAANASKGRRGSGDGPSVPVDFREAAQAESSRSHEWRQKLMRLVVGNRGSSSSRPDSAHASPHQSRDLAPSVAGQIGSPALSRAADAARTSTPTARLPDSFGGGGFSSYIP